MQTDLLRVLAKGGAKQQSSSKGTLPGNIVYQHLLGTFAISLRIPTPQIGPGTKHIDLLQIDSAGLDLEDRMFCKHFSKNMSMVSATHCCSNCAEADLPLCLPCVSPDILLSVFVLSLLFIFISFPFLFVFPFHLEAAQMKLKLTCCDASLSPVSLSLSLSLCLLGISSESHLGYLRELWPSSHRLADEARLKELANLLSGGKLSLYFLSIGRATNCLWHNHKQKLKQKQK